MNQLRPASLGNRRRRPALVVFGALLLSAALLTSVASAQGGDPRVGLAPGFETPGVAAHGMELLANRPKPMGFFNPANPGDFAFVNSDLALQGNHAFVGNFNGFQIYNVSDPANPVFRTAVVCPGGQGEVSVYRNPRATRCGSAACGSSTSRTSTRRSRLRPSRPAAARTRTRC